MKNVLFRALVILGLSVCAPSTLWAQSGYPSRTTTIVVPFAPGGVTDILARLIAQKLSERLGKPFVIENKGGAGTVLGALAVSRADPDGYTLLLCTNGTMAINPTLYKALPYDPAKDLVPVALVGSVTFVLVANPNLPVKNVSEMVALAKSKPGQLNYGSGGNGSSNSMFLELLLSMTGTKITHVPYRGNSPALADVVAGHVQFLFSDVSSADQLIKDGKLRAIAVSSAERFAGSPEIPTVAESGVPGYAAESWQMLVAPAGTPKEIVDKLNTEINAIINTPEMRDQISKLGAAPIGKGTSGELHTYVEQEIVRWGAVVKSAGIAGSQ